MAATVIVALVLSITEVYHFGDNPDMHFALKPSSLLSKRSGSNPSYLQYSTQDAANPLVTNRYARCDKLD